jgi:hypothetical protein
VWIAAHTHTLAAAAIASSSRYNFNKRSSKQAKKGWRRDREGERVGEFSHLRGKN